VTTDHAPANQLTTDIDEALADAALVAAYQELEQAAHRYATLNAARAGQLIRQQYPTAVTGWFHTHQPDGEEIQADLIQVCGPGDQILWHANRSDEWGDLSAVIAAATPKES
jgi:hypothetical protein